MAHPNLEGLSLHEEEEEGFSFEFEEEGEEQVDFRVTIKQVKSGTFLFHSNHPLNMDAVLNGGPWTFDNNLLLLERVQVGMQIENISLYAGTTLGNYIGKFVEYDKNNNSSFWRQYMRIRVRIDVRQPLKKDTKVKDKNGKWCVVNFKYEKLGTFCFVCGIMGHAENKCEVSFSMEQDYGKKEWSADIRADLRRQGGRLVSRWLKEERGGGEEAAVGHTTVQPNSPSENSSMGPTCADVSWQPGLSGPMKILSWNCRGLSTPGAIPNLQYIAQVHQPNIIFLSETLSKTQVMERIRVKLKFDYCLSIDVEGRSGGDLNDLLSQEDKKGVHPHPDWLCNGFRSAVGDCDLTDIQLNGYPYTWIKSRGTSHVIEERLDRAMANSSWLSLFPDAKLLNLLASHSDHSPILLQNSPMIRNGRTYSFRFENIWLKEDDVEEVVEDGWCSGRDVEITSRITRCADKLKGWVITVVS
ncbi:hypothetical protein TSUD_158890 [Trifolium subterraneum]|uniref:Zinc knuckle CX2CX4HX4C domain-containing protein n=1 Tax=Trifolium subterraneum TaxID=3900 RepID=A0A2Z6N3K3_TRISU|nr:hypothetical protein TSUD_158890 [Trifolium subterraneum]